MEKIADLNKYNNDMAKSLGDKVFFLDYIKEEDIKAIVDFGCADGTLLAAMPNSWLKLGVDNNQDMVDICFSKGIVAVENLDYINPRVPTLLNMSSVIHEVYSYLSSKEIAHFWDRVFNSGFEYISIRDMMISFDTEREPDGIYDEIFEKDGKYYNEYSDSFEHEWTAYQGYVPTQRDLMHYLLKYKYTDNWAREVKENYLPISVEYLKSLIPDTYEIVYEEEYVLPFLKDQIKKDFDYEIKDNTHIKLLLKRK